MLQEFCINTNAAFKGTVCRTDKRHAKKRIKEKHIGDSKQIGKGIFEIKNFSSQRPCTMSGVLWSFEKLKGPVRKVWEV